VLLGAGDSDAEHFFSQMAARRGDKFRAHIGFSERLAHQVQGASDFLIMPSRFEPCGLSQMYAQRYGTLPIVRATGGLVDTVLNYDERNGSGTGFVFQDLCPSSVANTMGWALSTYFDRPDHITSMRRQAMNLDYSWNRAAAEYEALYLEAYQRRRGHPFAP
jgi:starch synthase